MAGRGPSPKAAQLRRRRNVAAEFTPLPAQGRDGPIPELPGADALLESTRAWWDALWRSPMATQYIELDRYGLAMLARMLDMEARGDATAALRREIRLWEDRFGLSAAGRRSLRWHIVEPREATVDRPRNAV
jgi:hypothetical protein